MFNPIHIALAFEKNRWRVIYSPDFYDREMESSYSNIKFLLGDKDRPVLWQGGTKTSTPIYDTEKYPQWIVHIPTDIEKMIKERRQIK